MPIISTSLGIRRHIDLTAVALNIPSRSQSNIPATTEYSSRPQTTLTNQQRDDENRSSVMHIQGKSSINLNNYPESKRTRILSTQTSVQSISHNRPRHCYSDNTVTPCDISINSDRFSRTKTSSTRLLTGKSASTDLPFDLSAKGSGKNSIQNEFIDPNKNQRRKANSKYPNAKCCLASMLGSILAALFIGGITTGISLALLHQTSTTTSSTATSRTSTSTTTTTKTTTTTTVTTTITTVTTVTTATTTTRTTTTTGTINVVPSMTNGAWSATRQLQISCSVTLTNLTIKMTVQKTVNATYNSAYASFWGGTLSQMYIDTGTEIIYTWSIISGQTIFCPGSYSATGQMNLFGTAQPNGIDSYVVTTANSLGVVTTFSGFF